MAQRMTSLILNVFGMHLHCHIIGVISSNVAFKLLWWNGQLVFLCIPIFYAFPSLGLFSKLLQELSSFHRTFGMRDGEMSLCVCMLSLHCFHTERMVMLQAVCCKLLFDFCPAQHPMS